MWNSTEDVLNDAPYTGLTKLDDNYIVRGNRPPPRAPLGDGIDEDELNLRFGGLRNRRPSFEEAPQPDLSGITRMLRMVSNDSDSPPEARNHSPRKGNPRESPKKNTLVISKLNPDVPEFVPKISDTNDEYANSTTANNIAFDNKQMNDIKYEITDETIDNVKAKNDKNEHPSSIETAAAALTEEERMIENLKNTISAGAKGNPEHRRQRNVAMAALLRLKTGPPTPLKSSSNSTPKDTLSTTSKTESPSSSSSPKPAELPYKLEPPEYFAGPRTVPKVVEVNEKEHRIPEPRPLLEPCVRMLSPADVHDPHIKESIKKVMNWQVKEKPKTVVRDTGAVSFRKKDTSSPKSSKSPLSEVSKSSKEDLPPPPEDFVPSSYAAELKKQFEDRLKAKEEQSKKIEPPETLKKLEDVVGISFTFKRRVADDNPEL